MAEMLAALGAGMPVELLAAPVMGAAAARGPAGGPAFAHVLRGAITPGAPLPSSDRQDRAELEAAALASLGAGPPLLPLPLMQAPAAGEGAGQGRASPLSPAATASLPVPVTAATVGGGTSVTLPALVAAPGGPLAGALATGDEAAPARRMSAAPETCAPAPPFPSPLLRSGEQPASPGAAAADGRRATMSQLVPAAPVLAETNPGQPLATRAAPAVAGAPAIAIPPRTGAGLLSGLTANSDAPARPLSAAMPVTGPPAHDAAHDPAWLAMVGRLVDGAIAAREEAARLAPTAAAVVGGLPVDGAGPPPAPETGAGRVVVDIAAHAGVAPHEGETVSAIVEGMAATVAQIPGQGSDERSADPPAPRLPVRDAITPSGLPHEPSPAATEPAVDPSGVTAAADPGPTVVGEAVVDPEDVGGALRGPAQPALSAYAARLYDAAMAAGGGDAQGRPVMAPSAQGATQRGAPVRSDAPLAAQAAQAVRMMAGPGVAGPVRAVDQVAAALAVDVREGRMEAVITLRPDALGEVRAQITTGPEGVVIHLSAEREAVGELLRAQLGELCAALAGQHVQVADVHVLHNAPAAPLPTAPEPNPWQGQERPSAHGQADEPDEHPSRSDPQDDEE